MAKDLNSLVNEGTARELQQKLESWQRDYEGNTFGQNLNRCCEILELNSAIQKQLFSILNGTSRDDGQNEREDSVKHELVPSLASGGENSLTLSEGPLEGELPMRDVPSSHCCYLQELENKLCSTRTQIKQMEQDLRASRAEECKTFRELQEMSECEQKIQTLRDEIALLDCEKALLQNRTRCCSPLKCCPPVKCPRSKPCPLPRRSCSPVRTCRRASTSHRPCLIARFSSLYSQERVEAETNLRAYVCSAEMAQRIIYAAVVESFCVAKIAFWKVKIHVKEVLALDHLGPDALEVAALEYIACHKDLHDVCHSVEEVICCMNRNPMIACPSHVDFCVIRTFIRELCCLAFTMQTLIPPLDIAIGVDGEVYNKTMYYRSCNSDFTSSVVAYHIWPALMENGVVVVKGEVVTRSCIPCSRRSRIRSRSCSCGRRLLPGQMTRSRSLSTRRAKSKRY